MLMIKVTSFTYPHVFVLAKQIWHQRYKCNHVQMILHLNDEKKTTTNIVMAVIFIYLFLDTLARAHLAL